MHTRTQAEFDAFLKIKVYEGWQEGQLMSHLEALKEAGLPVALIKDCDVKYLRNLMEYLLLKLN